MSRVCRLLAAACLVQAATAALAQGTVYESKDKDGPVFSDKPSPGARVVDVPPPNVIAGPPVPPMPAPAKAAASAPAYRSLVITSPTAQGTVHSNTGAFGLTLRVIPALRPGDRIRVSLDGHLLPTSYRASHVRLNEGDWAAAAAADVAEHMLQVAVVDAQGQVLMESAPVSFYVRRATVGGARR